MIRGQLSGQALSGRGKFSLLRSQPKTQTCTGLRPPRPSLLSRPTPTPSASYRKHRRPSTSSLAPDRGGARLPTGRQSHDLGLFLANHWLPSQRPRRQQAQASRCPACHFLTLRGSPTEPRSGWWAGVRTKPSSSQTEVPACPAFPGPGTRLPEPLPRVLATGSRSEPR